LYICILIGDRITEHIIKNYEKQKQLDSVKLNKLKSELDKLKNDLKNK